MFLVTTLKKARFLSCLLSILFISIKIVVKTNIKVIKTTLKCIFYNMRGTGIFWGKKDREGILVSPFEIGFGTVYTIPMKKFGIRYPDGVEPSHTVVCYHKILFDADYLGRGRHQINFNKSQNNDRLLKDYFFYIHLKSRYCFKVLSKKTW